MSAFTQKPLFTEALVAFAFLFLLWNYLRRIKGTDGRPPHFREIKPLPITFKIPLDYMKALVSWVFLFMRVFWLTPGYYFMGERDDKAPLLVTANNFLTVFLLARRIGKRSVRLLVIDTKGVNVWCAAGKGQFSAKEIIEKAAHFGLIKEKEKTKMILPKFAMAGVNLAELRKGGVNPVIGPLYARDLPEYLDQGEFKNRTMDRVDFGLRARAFSALPTAVQFFYYFLGVYVVSLGSLRPGMIWLATVLAFLYPLLFPWLPGKRFCVKGAGLAAVVSMAYWLATGSDLMVQLSFSVFTLATCLFIALSYTGNSAVSSYSGVRMETARFLPVTVVLYVLFVLLQLPF